jgi:hypothetical protein
LLPRQAKRSDTRVARENVITKRRRGRDNNNKNSSTIDANVNTQFLFLKKKKSVKRRRRKSFKTNKVSFISERERRITIGGFLFDSTSAGLCMVRF